jgi:carbonic anhydrase
VPLAGGENDRYKIKDPGQCINIMKTAVVQKSFLKKGYPVVHAWVFDVRSGKLIDLGFDYQKTLEDIREIYDLGMEE